jgi:hypothetical protein
MRHGGTGERVAAAASIRTGRGPDEEIDEARQIRRVRALRSRADRRQHRQQRAHVRHRLSSKREPTSKGTRTRISPSPRPFLNFPTMMQSAGWWRPARRDPMTCAGQGARLRMSLHILVRRYRGPRRKKRWEARLCRWPATHVCAKGRHGTRPWASKAGESAPTPANRSILWGEERCGCQRRRGRGWTAAEPRRERCCR